MNGYTATIKSEAMPSAMAKVLNEMQHGQPRERLQGEEDRGRQHAHLAGRDRPRARPLDAAVEIAIDDVVPGAAGAAHRKRADEEQREMDEVWRGSVGGNCGKGRRPPAG